MPLSRALRSARAHGSTLGLTAALIAGSWLILYVAGGANTVPPHLMYFPIFFAGWRLGPWAAGVTAVAGGLVAGPLLPADIGAGTAQPVTDWAVRTVFFLLIGTFMSVIIQRWKRDVAREARVAQRERDLAVRETAFLESAAHEIRTPLTVIIGVVRTIEQRRMFPEESAPLFESLRRATSRLDRLTTVALASIGIINGGDRALLTVVDLRDVAMDLAGEMQALNARRRLLVDVPRELARLRTDERLLRPALGALVENALKFSPPAAPVEITSTLQEDRVVVGVRDFGPGMDPAFVARALDPFTGAEDTLRLEYQGLGIGLFAARRLIDRLDARLEILTHEGRGTEAMISLPRHALASEASVRTA